MYYTSGTISKVYRISTTEVKYRDTLNTAHATHFTGSTGVQESARGDDGDQLLSDVLHTCTLHFTALYCTTLYCTATY